VLRDLAAFEWRYHTRQAAFFAAAGLFVVMGYALAVLGFGADNVPVNSPYLVMESFGFLSLFALFAAAIFAANAVLRDDDSRMRDIVDSTPVPRLQFVFARFAGALLATLTAASFSIIGSIVALVSPWIDPARVAPFDVRPYLWAFATITIPNILFTVALIFAVAMLTRNALATYAASVVVYVLYFVCSALTNSPVMAQSTAAGTSGLLPALLDPFGLAAFFDVTRHWTAAVKSTRFVPMSGTLLVNRLLLIGGAVVLWGIAWKGRRKKPRKAQTRVSVLHGRAVCSTDTPVCARVMMELRSFFTKPVLLLYVLWIALAATELRSDVLDGEYVTTLYPATGLIVAALQQPLSIVGLLLIIYYGAEMFWREQRTRMASIIDTTPVTGGTMIAAKWTAMVVLIASLIVCGIGIGVAMQLSRGYTDFHPLLYLSLFYTAGLPLALYAAASLLIQAASPNKYVGMLLTVAFLVLVRRADDPLLRFASGPSPRYSDMIGFGDALPPFGKFMLHWSVLALLFAALAASMWRRVSGPLRERFTRPNRLAIVCALIALVTGTWLFATTDRESDSDQNDWRAAYERKYKPTERMPQPSIRAIDANVDFGKGVRVEAHYALVNKTSRPIDRVFVTVRRDVKVQRLSLPSVRDERFNIFQCDLARPLAPGAETSLDLSFTVDRDDDSLLLSFVSFPTLGYRRTYELRDPAERRKRGLPEMKLAEGGDFDASDAPDAIAFRAVVSAPAGQTAVAPGELKESWTRDGRSYFRYHADAPIRNRFGFASARYDVAKRQHGGIAIELYYHRAHAMNVAHMLDVAEASLDVMQATVGPYPMKQLRIVEVTSNAPFAGYALPGMIALREDRAFLTDMRDPNRFDLIARRVAHEVAHQWFGYRIAAAEAPGGLVITESLAKYAELLVLAKLHGREQVTQQLAMELETYLSGRARETVGEVPLDLVERQSYLYYSKGAIVLWAIRDLLGSDAMANAIHAVATEPRPAGINLARHLNHPLVDEWMNDITLYDFRIDDARAKLRADGRWDVTLRVNAAKVRADARGNETPIAMRETIEIDVDDHAERRELHDGVNELSFVVEKRPAVATVDPWITRIDRNPRDNSKPLQTQ